MKLSLQRHGYMKVGELLFLQGPQITIEHLRSAIRLLQKRHPFLRSRLQENPTKPDTFLMEEDENVQLNVREMTRNRNEYREFWRRIYRENEKQVPRIGEPLVEFWLLQDPNDQSDDNAPREIVIICEHSICDGVSLSVVAHELLIALSDTDTKLFEKSLAWPITMENAISNSSPGWRRFLAFARFIYAATYWRMTSSLPTSRIPFNEIDFTLGDMAKHCHTESFFDSLSQEETKKFIERCKQNGVTVTPAVGSAVIAAIAPLVSRHDNQETRLLTSLAADTRRRCVPIVPNHDLSYQVAGTLAFDLPTRNAPTTSESLWQVAKVFAQHLQYCIDSNQILSIGMIMNNLYQKSFDPPDVNQIPTCGISSWGVLPFQEQYGPWQLNGTLPLCNLISVAIPMVLLQTVNGVLTVACMGADPVFSPRHIENLCNETMRKLRQMIEDE